jgi:hypothetical protein
MALVLAREHWAPARSPAYYDYLVPFLDHHRTRKAQCLDKYFSSNI